MTDNEKQRAVTTNEAGGERPCWPVRVWRFYSDGFRSMTVGRYLWALIIIKLIILFAILKVFFFPNVLQENYDSDAERAEAVRSNLTTEVNH